jgi:hypothetical protein
MYSIDGNGSFVVDVRTVSGLHLSRAAKVGEIRY